MTGTEMRAIREAWGMTQAQFARAMGLGARTRVSEMEAGKRRIRGPLVKLIRLSERTQQIIKQMEGPADDFVETRPDGRGKIAGENQG